MNEKRIAIIVLIASHIVASLFGFWAGFEIGKGTANTRIEKLESELSDVLIINNELSEENTKHIETIQRIQGLTDESTRRIQLLESGIAELKGIGEEKDKRVIFLEDRVRELSTEVEYLGRKINEDEKRLTDIIRQFKSKNNSDHNRIYYDHNISLDYYNIDNNKVN